MNTTENKNYNASMIEIKNRGDGLTFPSEKVIKLGGLCVDVIEKIIHNEDNMKLFKEASINGIVFMNILKKIMKVRRSKRLKIRVKRNSKITKKIINF